MRAAVYRTHGGPELVELVERPVEEPTAGEVRVRMSVAGLNATDLKALRGDYRVWPIGPGGNVPGQDGIGIVDAVGPGTSLEVGQRVWLWEAGWLRSDGTLQEQVVVSALHAVPVPPAISDDLAASLGVPGLTAHRCLTAGAECAVLGPDALSGISTLVTGATGQVGRFAIQLARWAGATVAATCRRPEGTRIAESAGAEVAFAGDPDRLVEQLVDAGHRRFDLVIDAAPAANVPIANRLLSAGGSWVVYSDLAGPTVEVPVGGQLGRNSSIRFVGIYGVDDDAKAAAAVALTDAAAHGALTMYDRALVQRFVLSDAAAAIAAVATSSPGKVLVDVASDSQLAGADLRRR